MFNFFFSENRSSSSFKELKLLEKKLFIDKIINYIKKFPILLQRPIIFKYQNLILNYQKLNKNPSPIV